jgi:hypothetical protein
LPLAHVDVNLATRDRLPALSSVLGRAFRR